MNTMINLRDRGQISESMAHGIALNECYRDATSSVLRALGVTNGDVYFADEQQAEMARAAGEAACQKLQAKFDAQKTVANAEADRVNTVVRVLSGDLRGINVSLFNEFDQVKNIGYFSNGVWSICDVSELTESNKESLLNAKTNQVKAWAAEFLTKAVDVHKESSFVEADDITTLNADELKAARKAAKQAEKAAKIAAKKCRI